jgi:hypothetical protein
VLMASSELSVQHDDFCGSRVLFLGKLERNDDLIRADLPA